MNSAGNFHPEWGYLAPTPSFMRTVRVVLIATAIGATAGAGVVLSLIERSADDVGKTSIAATSDSPHILVTSVQAATPPVVITTQPVNKLTPPSVPMTAAIEQQTPVQPKTDAQTAAQPIVQPIIAIQSVIPPVPNPQAAAPTVSEASTASTPSAPASVAALAEVPPAVALTPAQGTDETAVDPVPGQKKATKKGHSAQHGEPAYGVNARGKSKSNEHGLAPILRRLFSARSSSSYYSN